MSDFDRCYATEYACKVVFV